MKTVMKKRIILYCPWTQEEIIGAEEYDGALSDFNIFMAFHEVGKTVWISAHPEYQELWYLKENKDGLRLPYYKVGIDDFYIEVPSFWDRIKNALR
jgi:hypothetical protein